MKHQALFSSKDKSKNKVSPKNVRSTLRMVASADTLKKSEQLLGPRRLYFVTRYQQWRMS